MTSPELVSQFGMFPLATGLIGPSVISLSHTHSRPNYNTNLN